MKPFSAPRTVKRAASKQLASRLPSAITPFLIGVALLSSCTQTEKAGGPTVDAVALGGTIIDAVPTNVSTLFPPAADNSLDLSIINALYDHLADIGDSLNVVGDAGFVKQLATGWTWAADSLSIAFTINPKARWHDGAPVIAKDVQFTFTAYADPRSGSANPDNVANIDSVHVVDSLTAVFFFKRRTPHQFFDATYQMYVLPSHLLENIPVEKLGSDSLVAKPVGTGRFRFVQWVPGQTVEIEADTGNYRTRAKLDRVIWAMSGNASSATLSVFTGNADLYEKLNFDDLSELPKHPNLTTLSFSEIGYSYMAFNFRDRKDHAKPHPILSDIRVRRALTMAIDREKMVRSVFDTFATVGIGPSPRSVFQDAALLKPIPFDIAHARALLDSAGWILPPGKTVRVKNAVPLAIEMVTQASSQPRKQYATTLEQQFKAIGVSATAKAVPPQGMRLVAMNRDFDLLLWANTLTPGLLGMPGSWGTNGSGNLGGYSDPDFDVTLDGALNANSPTVARPLWLRAMQLITDDAAAVWIYEESTIELLHRRIRPAALRHDMFLAHLADWAIDPAQRIARDRPPTRGRN
ncbi:MAG: peptide ABC transporter substrate-binding protein [Gemmatimonadaceae bacterium]